MVCRLVREPSVVAAGIMVISHLTFLICPFPLDLLAFGLRLRLGSEITESKDLEPTNTHGPTSK
jgi:hypothetical protein